MSLKVALAPSSPVFQAADRPGCKLDQNERSEALPHWLEKAINQIPAQAVWRYPDRRELEAALAEKFGLEDGMVLVGNGGDEVIQYLIADLPAGTPLIAPLPTFGFYREQAAIWPVKPVFLPAKDDLTFDLEACRSAIRENPNGVFILIRPNNPTGEMVSREEALELLALCREHNTLVLLDEAYAEFADDDLLDQLQANPHLVILRTFSKAYGLAGLRLGYFLASAELLNRLRKRVMPYNVSGVTLHLGLAALQPNAEGEVRTYCERVIENRRYFEKLLAEWGIRSLPSQANFITMQLGDARAAFVGKVMAAQGFAVRTFNRAPITGCVRFSIPADTCAFKDALMLALKPDLLCLDVDGTLIDVVESFDTAVTTTVEHYTGQTPDRDEILALRAAGGYNDDFQLAAELVRRRGVAVDLEALKDVFRGIYFGDETRAGANQSESLLINDDLWARWKQRALDGSWSLALVTGRDRKEMAHGLTLLDYPEDQPVYTIDDVAVGKPDPEGIRAAAERTGRRRIWMVGDNLDDIRAAHAAGAVAIGVGENREALEAAGCAVFLDDINQLETLL
ncbi:aminotransferase class I/II-fold pyridoxal phosphate-dependent enzyme [Acanthopleuribacter pedis]|uniref:histidinol-phosphate transaminase n=1 Tax=Acanthopleuribacter pedis TaxID=442870 RepID=A0A8J7QA29_9BACT|nr:aminotransferase class I/II-fold pyridoxal phosphate-dependent enzyme [Acanthopleuribacter pedis]MBO1320229.1 aminotransferase class I/II-fold pyridoxal phosphate-dependent enzyme [Acanthopleuribacter pedis]